VHFEYSGALIAQNLYFGSVVSIGGGVVMTELVVTERGLVNLRFWRLECICHLTVDVDFSRCFLTSWAVKPGQVLKSPASIASIHVDGTGLNAASFWTSFN